MKALHAKIRQQALELDFFANALGRSPRSERKAMIDRKHRLSVTRQGRLLALSRASVYYMPRSTSDAHLALMRRIDGCPWSCP